MYGAGGRPAAEEAAAPGPQSAAAAAAAPYVPRFSVPLPARLAGALPGSARELKVRAVTCLRLPIGLFPSKGLSF